MVPEVGLEPTQGRPYQILSLACLPFHHSGIKSKIVSKFRLKYPKFIYIHSKTCVISLATNVFIVDFSNGLFGVIAFLNF